MNRVHPDVGPLSLSTNVVLWVMHVDFIPLIGIELIEDVSSPCGESIFAPLYVVVGQEMVQEGVVAVPGRVEEPGRGRLRREVQ